MKKVLLLALALVTTSTLFCGQKDNIRQQELIAELESEINNPEYYCPCPTNNDAELKKLIILSGSITATLSAIPLVAAVVLYHKLIPLYQEMLEAKKAFTAAPVATAYDLVRTNLFG
ncbi:hypothetical protein K2X40_01570 [Candidatus Babeliales bacterium]|nr:hypothetical protein [Candidatus Babeliales bacterium]